jgi:hypothetical protein
MRKLLGKLKMNPDQDNHWSLDRRVPIAVIMAIVAQAAAGVWMFATQSAKIDQLIQTDIKHDTLLAELTRGREDSASKILVIDNTLRAITKQLDRIELRLDRQAKADTEDPLNGFQRKVTP